MIAIRKCNDPARHDEEHTPQDEEKCESIRGIALSSRFIYLFIF